MSIDLNLFIYLVLIVVSFFSDMLFKHMYFIFTKNHFKENHFVLSRYIMSLVLPLLVLYFIYIGLGSSVINIFIATAVFGTFFEYVIGWWYKTIMGSRLWTYNKLSINKYTSFLSIPLWGFMGVVIFIVVKFF